MHVEKKIFIIAGEESGDNMGAKLIERINKVDNAKVKLLADFIGGYNMEKASGQKSLFPMKEINLMGFLEILPHIFHLKKRIKQTAKHILAGGYDCVLTIDSPGFNYRVAKLLKNLGYKGRLIHYVAPSVWAYKEKRVLKTAEIFDELLTILPWEAQYFTPQNIQRLHYIHLKKQEFNADNYKIKVTYVGHPTFEDIKTVTSQEKSNFASENNILLEEKKISLLAGSRVGEVRRILPVYLQVLDKILNDTDNSAEHYQYLLLTTYNQQKICKAIIRDFINNNDTKLSLQDFHFFINKADKRKALAIADCAFVKSGTVALEVAAMRVPHFICYKVNNLSACILRKFIKIKFANLINYAADKELIKELIQEKFTVTNVYNAAQNILKGSKQAYPFVEIDEQLAKMGLVKDLVNPQESCTATTSSSNNQAGTASDKVYELVCGGL